MNCGYCDTEQSPDTLVLSFDKTRYLCIDYKQCMERVPGGKNYLESGETEYNFICRYLDCRMYVSLADSFCEWHAYNLRKKRIPLLVKEELAQHGSYARFMLGCRCALCNRFGRKVNRHLNLALGQLNKETLQEAAKSLGSVEALNAFIDAYQLNTHLDYQEMVHLFRAAKLVSLSEIELQNSGGLAVTEDPVGSDSELVGPSEAVSEDSPKDPPTLDFDDL